MKEIEKYIKKLLLKNDCVILPGFGGFITHYSNAFYSDTECRYVPPKREIGFNQNLIMNDSLLVQELIENYDVSYPEALQKIERNIEELRQILSTEGCYSFNGIGIIKMNEEGLYTFTPFSSGILTPDYYALSAFEIKKISTENLILNNPEEKNNVQEPSQILINKASSDITDNEDFKDTGALKIPMTAIRYIAAAAIAILVFLLSPNQLNQNVKQFAASNKADISMLSKITNKIDAFSERTTTLNKVKENIANSQISLEKESEEAINEPEKFFTVVLASKVSKRNAANYTQELNKRGLREVFALYKENSSRVLCGKFKTENEAYNLQRKLSHNDEFKDCWVMEITK